MQRAHTHQTGSPARGPRGSGDKPLFLAGLLSLLLVLLTVSQARASYTEHLAKPQERARASQSDNSAPTLAQSRLVHLNGPISPYPVLHSLGRDLPLAHALALLTPRGWLARDGHRAPMTRVSWEANRPWLETLERVAGQSNTLIVLNWEERTFRVEPYSAKLYARLAGESPKALPEATNRTGEKATDRGTANVKSQAKAPAAPQKGSAKTVSQETNERPDLIVSHYAGPGRVRLARDMSVEEASRVLDTRLSRLMAWNDLQDKKALLPKGTLLWVAKPDRTRAQKAPKAETQTKTQTKTQTQPMPKAESRPAPSVARALQSAQTQSRVQAQARIKPVAATAPAANEWVLAPGSLKRQVVSWAARAGYSVVWQADTDLHMNAGARFAGSFAQAIRALFEGLHAAGAPYTAHLFHGNHVLHVGDR